MLFILSSPRSAEDVRDVYCTVNKVFKGLHTIDANISENMWRCCFRLVEILNSAFRLAYSSCLEYSTNLLCGCPGSLTVPAPFKTGEKEKALEAAKNLTDICDKLLNEMTDVNNKLKEEVCPILDPNPVKNLFSVIVTAITIQRRVSDLIFIHCDSCWENSVVLFIPHRSLIV